jgi:hypothetical protein
MCSAVDEQLAMSFVDSVWAAAPISARRVERRGDPADKRAALPPGGSDI